MRSFYKTIIILLFLSTSSVCDETSSSGHRWSYYTGTFDFSDDGKRSTLFGIQHINDNLYRESFIGTLQPVTGVMITADDAKYIYTGFQTKHKSGALTFTPSFTPGLYSQGNGKDLGHAIEFKTEIQLSLEISSNSEIAFSYNHISNASLGDKNPGANSYMFNFLQKF